jgi:hypothetical protein
MEVTDHHCKTCHWGRFNWCKDGAKISNIGNCPQWRPIKLSNAQKAEEATVMKAAHASDVARKVEEKKKTKRGKK